MIKNNSDVVGDSISCNKIFDLNKVPNNDSKLKEIAEIINNLKRDYERVMNLKYSDEYDRIERIENAIYNCLLGLADLSIPIFNLMDEIEETYFNKYNNNPDLARKEWLKLYRGLHLEYDRQKERCFRLLNTIEKRFPMKIRKQNEIYQKYHKEKLF